MLVKFKSNIEANYSVWDGENFVNGEYITNNKREFDLLKKQGLRYEQLEDPEAKGK